MDVAELIRKLDEAGVPSSVYDFDLDGLSLPSERYCLRSEGRFRWLTYFSERGEKVGEHVWISEDQACGHLLQVLLRENDHRDPRNRGEGGLGA